MSEILDAAPRVGESFIELSAHGRAAALLDPGETRVLLGPFDRLKSPWLPLQDVVAQADDGVVIMRGAIDGAPAVVIAIEGRFQGGSIGEVSGAKIAGALELTLKDHLKGVETRPVIVFETGGVRLQEANLGLAAIAEIHAGIVALWPHTPVVGVISGMTGCFGGMSLAAGLCTHLIATRQARLGMNGPEVIEQEAGIAELDASDRALVWSLIGGEQRVTTGLIDHLVGDDAPELRSAVRQAFTGPVQDQPRALRVRDYAARMAAYDPSGPIDPLALRRQWCEASQ